MFQGSKHKLQKSPSGSKAHPAFNELPIEIRSSDSIVTFKHRLKEHLRGLY